LFFSTDYKQTKLLGIIIVDFDVTDQLLSGYFNLSDIGEVGV